MREPSFSRILLVASVLLNLALGHRLLSLQRPAAEDRPQSGPRVIQSVELVSTQGERITLDFRTERDVILYFFSIDCGWCDVNLANFFAVVRQAKLRRIPVFAIAAASGVALREYQTLKGIDFELYSVDPIHAREAGFRKTPTTAVVSSGGRVLVWIPGIYSGESERAIEHWLGVELPGPVINPTR